VRQKLRNAALALMLLTFTLAASAEGWFLESAYLSSRHQASTVWSGQFTALNGVYYDASEFYESKRISFSGNLGLAFLSDQSAIYIPLFFDTGYESELYSASPFVSVGAVYSRVFDNTTISVGAQNFLQLGGGISESPCVDAYQREFHCGSGLAWSDFKKDAIRRVEYPRSLTLRATIKF